MNASAAPEPDPKLSPSTEEEVRSCLADVREEITRLLQTADMMHEGAVIPNWDTDCALPVMRLNRGIYFLESLLGLDRKERSVEV